MKSYVEDELPALVAAHFPIDPGRQAITGHSMGGHGALTIGLRNPERFRSVSAFAPIVAPGRVPWGEKALAGHLGDDRSAWRPYDHCAPTEDGAALPQPPVDSAAGDPLTSDQVGKGLVRETSV